MKRNGWIQVIFGFALGLAVASVLVVLVGTPFPKGEGLPLPYQYSEERVPSGQHFSFSLPEREVAVYTGEGVGLPGLRVYWENGKVERTIIVFLPPEQGVEVYTLLNLTAEGSLHRYRINGGIGPAVWRWIGHREVDREEERNPETHSWQVVIIRAGGTSSSSAVTIVEQWIVLRPGEDYYQ